MPASWVVGTLGDGASSCWHCGVDAVRHATDVAARTRARPPKAAGGSRWQAACCHCGRMRSSRSNLAARASGWDLRCCWCLHARTGRSTAAARPRQPRSCGAGDFAATPAGRSNCLVDPAVDSRTISGKARAVVEQLTRGISVRGAPERTFRQVPGPFSRHARLPPGGEVRVC